MTGYALQAAAAGGRGRDPAGRVRAGRSPARVPRLPRLRRSRASRLPASRALARGDALCVSASHTSRGSAARLRLPVNDPPRRAEGSILEASSVAVASVRISTKKPARSPARSSGLVSGALRGSQYTEPLSAALHDSQTDMMRSPLGVSTRIVPTPVQPVSDHPHLCSRSSSSLSSLPSVAEQKSQR